MVAARRSWPVDSDAQSQAATWPRFDQGLVIERSGAPSGTRTHDLQVRNLTLYPLSYGRAMPAETGGEGGIRTPDGCNPITV